MDTALDGLESPSLLERKSEQPDGVPEEVRAHFDACPACRSQWQLLSRAEAALRAPRIVPAPAGMLAEFRERLAAEERHLERRPVNPFSRWLWPMGSVAAAGLAAAFIMSMNIRPQLFVGLEPPVSSVRDATTTDMTFGTLSANRGSAAEGSAPVTEQSKTFSTSDRNGLTKVQSSGVPLPDRKEGPQVNARTNADARSGGVEKRLPALRAPGSEPLSKTAGNDPRNAVASAIDVQDRVSPMAAFKSKTTLEAKDFRETRDRYSKNPEATQLRMGRSGPQTAPLAAGAQAGLGGGGLGGGGELAPAGPASPAGLAAEPEARALRLEAADRLSVLADKKAEQESLLAAEVSPALVTALQRPVSLNQRGPESVLTVLGRLSREADIEVQLEGKVSQLALSLQSPVQPQRKKDEALAEKARGADASQVPLWVALQSVAQQGKLQVVPEENRLVLRPIEAKSNKALPNTLMTRRNARPSVALKEDVRLQTTPLPPIAPTLAKGSVGQPSTAKPAADGDARASLYAVPPQAQQNLYYFAYPALPNPDPRVWPSMWGDLPK